MWAFGKRSILSPNAQHLIVQGNPPKAESLRKHSRVHDKPSRRQARQAELLLAVGDTTFGQIVRGNLDRDLVARQNANEMKTQQAAKRQIEDILFIRQRLGFTLMDEKIKQIAILRLDYPEASLNELCEAYQEEYDEEISKSGMKHRLGKIKAMADRIREQMQQDNESE